MLSLDIQALFHGGYMPTVPNPKLVDELARLFNKKSDEIAKRNPNGMARNREKIMATVLESRAIRHPQRKSAYRKAIFDRAPELRDQSSTT